MDTTAFQVSTRPDPKTEIARTVSPAETACLPEPSGLTRDEIYQIVLDLIG